MAKNCGPGVSERGGVRTTMGNANNASTNQPSNGMKAPFDKAHSTGGGGIPVTMYDQSMKAPKMPSPSQPGPGSTGGQQRSGTK